jgi:hypothetical protein
MTTAQLRPWSQVVSLDHDVESGNTAVAAYAIDLGALVAGDPRIPRVYRQPADFFAVTHLTSGLRRLLSDVLSGLTGGSGDRVLQLRSPFGGGKSHTLAALYHAANDRGALDLLPECAALPRPGAVRIAVFDGEKFDVQGRLVEGQQVYTMWGAVAAQLGRYDAIAYHDANRIAPGGDRIAEMLGDGPTLILLDEVLKYLERAGAEVVGDSTLGRQTQDFVQSLSVEVARSARAVLVYSLQASTREALGNEALLAMLDHLTSRVDAKREPVSGDEILPVLRRRLLREPWPSADDTRPVAEAYAAEITRMRAAHGVDEASRRAAEDDRLALRDRILAAYPFHPALIDIMRERWASLPDFQRTRGALRFLAVCLYTLKQANTASALLGPGDIAIEKDDVVQAFFTEVGQREPFKAVLERDFRGPNARIGRIDERLSREHPELSGVRPAMRIATAILAYSFGGLTRRDEQGGEPIATGVTETELLSAVVSPELDDITARAVLNELRTQCLFLHFDGAHYAFKTTPNVTQLLEDQAVHVRPREIEDAIEADLVARLSGRHGAIVWPRTSQGIPDREPRFLLAYLPLDFAALSDTGQEQQAKKFFTLYGDAPRRYRNGLGLAIPGREPVDTLRRATRYLKAIALLKGRRQEFNLTSAQVNQLNQRETTEKTAFESAMRDLYASVWLPVFSEIGLAIEKVGLAGRPLQATTVHERLSELLTVVSPPRLFSSLRPGKIVELLRLGVGADENRAVGVDQVIAAFYEVPGLPRLESDAAIRQAIAAGVQEHAFGLVGRASQTGRDEVSRLREASGYLVSPRAVQIGVPVPADNIEPAAAFIIVPEAIESEAPPIPTPYQPQPTVGGATPSPGPTVVAPGITRSTPGAGTDRRTAVRLAMRMTRREIFASANALANLADKAGSIQVTVEAEKADGFDPAWLHNAVLEPLEEADVRVEEQE